MIIYKVTNAKNNLIYIGQTTRDLETRMQEHLRKKQTYFDKCYCKKNISDFVVEQIDSAESIEELNQKEIYYIDKYNSIVPNGHNACIGGDNTIGFHHSDESRNKMSNSKKGKYTGEKNHYFGKHHSEEVRQKMKEAWKLRDKKECSDRLKSSHYKVKVICIETNEIFDSIKEASNKYNLIPTHITRVCKGLRKTTGGFHWKYVE